MTGHTVEVWPVRTVKKLSGRRQYIDSAGNSFVGTHRSAYVYYTDLHRPNTIKLNTVPNSEASQ